ncbi:MAG TPA: hypothetical protein VKE93_22110 [Candidatus Angelobacter sp.]|nr:hypothetical protein [Candidatus Angelobacter sp.]
MRKLIISMVVGLAALAQAQAGQDKSQPKVIADPAEYQAYITAINLQDPAQKAAALESFIQQYPATVVKSDALELLLAAYGANNNQPMLEQTAARVLAGDPNNLRALAVATSIERSKGTPESIANAGANAQKGLQALAKWTKPEGMSDTDFENLKNRMAEIFDGASAFAALQSKDYAAAREHYLKSLAKDPDNVLDAYQLAIAELETTPLDLDGFWYGAKALRLAADNDTRDAIARYIKGKYKKYHGKIEDWDKFAAAVASQKAPPANMAELIPPAPTPCDLAVRAVKDNKPEDLSLSDWEFILSKANCSPANKEAAGIIWQTILDKQKPPQRAAVKLQNKKKTSPAPGPMLKLPGVLVLSATPKTMQVAVTLENQCAKKADLAVNFEKPVLHPPAAGATIDVVGAMTAYRAEPFLFTMEKGALQRAKPVTLNCDQLRAGTF